MTEKELKIKDSLKGLSPILLPAPVMLHGYGEKEQSDSRPGVESTENFTEDAFEDNGLSMIYSQCC